MQKERTIGTTTLKTPYIGMGTWAIGGGTWWGENDDALSIRTIEEAIDRESYGSTLLRSTGSDTVRT